MKEGKGDRREFLRAAGAAMAAAALPAVVIAQQKSEVADDVRTTGREQVLMLGYGGNPNLQGTYGRGRYQIILDAQIGLGGYGSIRDDVYPELNAHFKITSATRVTSVDGGYSYEFTGITTDARDPAVSGKITGLAVDPSDPSGSCRGVLTIESTPIADVTFWMRNMSGTYGTLV